VARDACVGEWVCGRLEVWASVGRVEVWVEWAGRSASGSMGWLVRRGVGEWVGGSVYGCDLVGVGDAMGGRSVGGWLCGRVKWVGVWSLVVSVSARVYLRIAKFGWARAWTTLLPPSRVHGVCTSPASSG
jgi:hypothetical protein